MQPSHQLSRVDRTNYEDRLLSWLPKARIEWDPRLELSPNQNRELDGKVQWESTDGSVIWVVEYKANVTNQNILFINRHLNERRKNFETIYKINARRLLLAPYIRSSQAEVLRQMEVDYLDLAGNVHLSAPGLYVHVEGKKLKQPQQIARNKGWIKTVMVLLTRPGATTLSVRDIAELADVSTGTVSLVLNELRDNGYLLGKQAKRRLVRRRDLLPEWVHAYVERLRPRLQEQSLRIKAGSKQEVWARLGNVLSDHKIPWTLTGADGALRMDGFFYTHETELYVSGVENVTQKHVLMDLQAQPDKKGNVTLISAPSGFALLDTMPGLPPPTASTLLIYAELTYRGGDQAREAAERMLDYLVDNNELPW
ncbi:LacI family DNA-binding transcriptional regulator [bacterium]|nr:LacI family DNA-binding transcriptional regulator [bacterium]